MIVSTNMIRLKFFEIAIFFSCSALHVIFSNNAPHVFSASALAPSPPTEALHSISMYESMMPTTKWESKPLSKGWIKFLPYARYACNPAAEWSDRYISTFKLQLNKVRPSLIHSLNLLILIRGKIIYIPTTWQQ